jgi:hypothetical protein
MNYGGVGGGGKFFNTGAKFKVDEIFCLRT